MHPQDNQLLYKNLLAAAGYLQLQMDDEARRELAEIALESLPESFDRILFLTLSLMLAIRANDFIAGLELASQLATMDPGNMEACIHGAFCLHELGKTEMARDLLMAAPPEVKKDPVYQYNLGCYHAVLGARDLAIAALRIAFKADPVLKSKAAGDPDLCGLEGYLP